MYIMVLSKVSEKTQTVFLFRGYIQDNSGLCDQDILIDPMQSEIIRYPC